MNGHEIYEALALMRSKWPTEEVSIWVEDRPTEHVNYVARVGNGADGHPSVFAHGTTAVEAAEALILKVGVRDPRKLLHERIQTLQAELDKLQANLRFESCDGKNIDAETGLIAH